MWVLLAPRTITSTVFQSEVLRAALDHPAAGVLFELTAGLVGTAVRGGLGVEVRPAEQEVVAGVALLHLALDAGRPDLVGTGDVVQETAVALVVGPRREFLGAPLVFELQDVVAVLGVGGDIAEVAVLGGDRNVEDLEFAVAGFEHALGVVVLALRGCVGVPAVEVLAVEEVDEPGGGCDRVGAGGGGGDGRAFRLGRARVGTGRCVAAAAATRGQQQRQRQQRRRRSEDAWIDQHDGLAGVNDGAKCFSHF
jgi:hypothetical protein